MTNNTTAADLDRDIAHLIDSSESGIARVPRETLVRLRELFALQHNPIRDQQHEAARKRVAAFLDAYSILRGADQEKIHSINFTPLLVADLRALLTSPRAAGLPNVIEKIAEQWDGCFFDAPGGCDIDIGEAIRAAAKRLDAAPAAPVAEPMIDIEQMLRDCVPGGDIVDPQLVCDSIRSWFEDRASVAAQAVAADGGAKPSQFFVYDAEGCYFETFATDAVRDKAHRDLIAEYRVDARQDQEWPDAVAGIISGIITHTTSEVWIDNTSCDYEPRAAVSPAPTVEGAHTDRVRWALSDVCREACITSSDLLSEAFARAMRRYFGAAVSPATTDERAAFEADCLRRGYASRDLTRIEDGYYVTAITYMWDGWQAARASQAAAPADAREPSRVGRADIVDGRVQSFSFEQTDIPTGSYSLYTAPVSVPADAGEAVAPAGSLVPTERGIYAWVAEGSSALVLVHTRPTAHSPGGVMNASLLRSCEFYNGCPVDQWSGGTWYGPFKHVDVQGAQGGKGGEA